MTNVRILGTVPVVPVTDVGEAIAFYRDTLGFTLAFEQGAYAGVDRGAAHVHLDGVVNAAAGQVTVRVTVEGVDALYAEIEPKGVVDPAEPLNTKPWGARQFSVLDCCGNRLTFVEGA
jgi:uncharacterized glyoxalase superfamily protein PhnB